tara:strand:- start:41 stop:922 length:882 start_codon:yes stop_codon:yes gene_type:complete
MADKTILGGGGPVEVTGPLTTQGTGTHSGENTYSNAVDVTHSTQSTSKTSGALKVAGGVGISKQVFIGEKLHCEVGQELTGSFIMSGSAQFTGSIGSSSINVSGSLYSIHVPAISCTGSMTFTSGSISTHVLVPIHGVGSALAPITHTAGGNLIINTLNVINVSAGAHQTFNMPAAAACTAGDTVVVKYVGDVPNTYFHKYDTDAASFDPASFVFRASPINADTTAGQAYLFVTPPNGSSHDVFTVTGSTNGGCGSRSQFNFVYTGTTWRLWDGIIHPGGSGNNGASGSFGTT